MQTIPITAATDNQLRECAKVVLMQDEDAVNNCKSRAELLALIGPAAPEAWGDNIQVPDAAPAATQTGQAEPAVRAPDQVFLENLTDEFGPLTRFTIIATDMVGGKHPAHPCVNGRQLVMQRNMLIEAPYAFYLALKNARTGAPYEIENGLGRAPDIGFSEVTNYPLTDEQLPSKEEIAAWHARNGSRELGTAREPARIAA